MITLLLALAATGQIRQCATATTYRQQAVVSYQQATVAYAPQAYLEKVAFVAVEPYTDAYYSSLVGSQVRGELKAKANLEADADLAARVGQLADAVGRLEARIGGSASPVPGPTPPTTPTPDQPPPPTGSGPSAPPPPLGAITQPNAAVLGYFKTNCLKCHAAPARAGAGFVMFNEDGSFANLHPLSLVDIDRELYSTAMPKEGKQITTQEYSDVRAWIFENDDAVKAAVKACKQKGAN